MAPPSSKDKSGHPRLQITFPKHISHKFAGKKEVLPLIVEDFQLSWLDYFKKYDSALYRELAKQNRLTIMDIRSSSTRKVWKLNKTIKQFIDSFGRTLQAYKAVIGKQPSNTDDHVAPAAQTPSSSVSNGSCQNPNRGPISNGATARASNSNSPSMKRLTIPVQDLRGKNKPPCYSPSNTRSSSRNKPGDSANLGPSTPSPLKRKISSIVPPGEPPKRALIDNGEFRLQVASNGNGAGSANGTTTRGIPRTQFTLPPVVVDVDDSASMAPTIDSQDSQEDLIEAGVKIEDVKTDVMKRLESQFDNNTMLRMKHELQELVKSKKYFPTLRRLPFTASMLQYIFKLNN